MGKREDVGKVLIIEFRSDLLSDRHASLIIQEHRHVKL